MQESHIYKLNLSSSQAIEKIRQNIGDADIHKLHTVTDALEDAFIPKKKQTHAFLGAVGNTDFEFCHVPEKMTVSSSMPYLYGEVENRGNYCSLIVSTYHNSQKKFFNFIVVFMLLFSITILFVLIQTKFKEIIAAFLLVAFIISGSVALMFVIKKSITNAQKKLLDFLEDVFKDHIESQDKYSVYKSKKRVKKIKKDSVSGSIFVSILYTIIGLFGIALSVLATMYVNKFVSLGVDLSSVVFLSFCTLYISFFMRLKHFITVRKKESLSAKDEELLLGNATKL